MKYEKILINESLKPDNTVLKSIIGSTFEYYEKIIDKTKKFTNEWKYYNKKSGWSFKIFDKKKTLLWLFPYKNFFLTSFALRENEKSALLESKMCDDFKEILKISKKYPEGYAFRIDITNDKTFKELDLILNIIINLRK